ncbi:type IV secretory system conjugative DNA transfer family protein [Mycolicibacterium mageritense]|uniref:type IV secretory system conjugative DNA transfer family protein n=1 Tax=Mycolicibacterium mageritense TaxID=53462 RepID=UPI0011DADF67|nr:TraM recognition domain-containing protein [Mycolicibacterium mageritense]TXI58902.1 MAG: type IV secretory system conjugative DNA transfer family protein [Mycolicibacterium mageritense]
MTSTSANPYRAPVTPFAGWVFDELRGRLVPLETAPHIGAFAPPGTGKTRKWLSQAAVLWPGPAVVSSSKDDLMQMVASRRFGPAALLDLRPIAAPYYPAELQAYRFDPAAWITSLEDAKAVARTLLSTSSVALSGSGFRSSDSGPWDDLAFAPLTCLLYAASPHGLGLGIDWVLEAAENVSLPEVWPSSPQMSSNPSWVTAAVWTANRYFEARVRSVLQMEAKQRDSVKITVTKVLTAWLQTMERDRGLPVLDADFLEDPSATIYLLTPFDGTVAAQAITLMDQLINRQRVKVAQWEEFARLGMFLDEITNTPLPFLPQYIAESRGLGVSLCFAAQAGEQLDAIYGPLQGAAIRAVVPASLLMYGSHEKDLMESASFWSGKTTRSQQSYDHSLDSTSSSRSFGNALEPEELMPPNDQHARLVVRGTPGQMVTLIDWTEFVEYLDELRAARSAAAGTPRGRAAARR